MEEDSGRNCQKRSLRTGRDDGINPCLSTKLLHVPFREFQKSRPVRRGGVSSVVLPEAKVAIEQGSLHRRKLSRAQVFFPEQTVHRASRDFREEHSFCIDPSVAICRSSSNEDRPRSAQSNQVMRIDG